MVAASAQADPGQVLASSFLAYCHQQGLRADARLRLLAWESTTAPARPIGHAGDLGTLHETLVVGHDRTARGAWYTPPWLARQIVDDAVRRVGVVADPSCGGGVFLLAAADRLERLGAAPGHVVGGLLWGADIDPVAVAVTEAALWLWAADRGAPTLAGHRLVIGDPLVDCAIPRAAAVVGNPPFLGQLKSATTVDDARRRALKDRWGPAVRPYTDAGWLFLLAAVESLEPGGRASLVQPQSLLGARDAGAVRAAVDRRAVLEGCWIDGGRSFQAAVDVCAPLLRAGTGAVNDWPAALADARGVPPVALAGERRLGEVADVVAGFRDEYYGLVDAVREDGTGPRLVTVGAIDPLGVRAGAAVRFAKRRWQTPTVDPAAATGRAGRWVSVQTRPKLLVATQTRVLEAAPDPDGSLVGSVPVVAVLPHVADELWLLAAALHAPVVSAWMLRRSAGTALSSDACKPTVALLAQLPLPSDTDAWNDAATLARELADGCADRSRWAEFGLVADRAYGVEDPTVREWWLSRLPRP